MRLSEICRLWNLAFFKPQSCLPIALFRLFVGLLALFHCLLIGPDLVQWYGEHGWVLKHAGVPAFDLASFSRIYLFSLLPAGDQSTITVYWLMVISSAFLAAGLVSNASAVLLWLCLMSMHAANPYADNAGIALLSICVFILIFSACGRRIAIDGLLFRRGKDANSAECSRLCSPWPQRLLQLQIASVYFQAFWGKLGGHAWLDGSTVYYVAHLSQYVRIPMPFIFENALLCTLATWATLVVEFLLWSLIWVKEFRYPILMIGLMLHVGIDAAMNVPIFEYLMIASYVLFIDAEDLTRVWNFIKKQRPAFFRRRSSPSSAS
jgi:hypothetical protein